MDKENLRKVFESRGYKVFFFEKGVDAARGLAEMVDKDKSIAFGGSMTLKEIEADKVLRDKGVEVIWHWDKTIEEPLKKARLCDYYASSANGVSLTGEIVNIDGNGNRVSSLAFGHKKVFIVIGKNKIENTLEEALYRARHTAGAKNAQRFEVKTPCKATGECNECKSPEKICKIVEIFEHAPGAQETILLFVDEELGY